MKIETDFRQPTALLIEDAPTGGYIVLCHKCGAEYDTKEQCESCPQCHEETIYPEWGEW